MEGQQAYGLTYLGAGLAGRSYAGYILGRYQESFSGPDDDFERDAFEANPNTYEKKIRLGEQIAMSAGSISAYHAYRSAVETYQDGRYRFLGEPESPTDIMLAPFRFDFMTKTSTLAPVLIAAGIHLLAITQDFDSEELEDYEKVPLDGDGVFYSGAYSYFAGTNEEALFRGWLLPEMYVAFGSEFWAKVANAALFGAAHLGNISTPLPQLLFGYYLSDLTIENNWKISEAVFIHTWWNVFAFLTVHQIRKKEDAQAVFAPLVVPILNQRF
jgi:membrane protease YdiL (CAAX protease family)